MAREFISDEIARQIRNEAAAGESNKALAEEYGLHAVTISRIVCGRIHLDAGGPTRRGRPRLPEDPTEEDLRQYVLDRLLADSHEDENGCLLWDGGTEAAGYGVVHLLGRSRKVHRLAYETLVGPVPDGLVLDHQCHNADETCRGGVDCPHRRCWNVEHLVAHSRAENTRLGRVGLHNREKTHCPEGHPYADDNLMTRPRPNGLYARSCLTCHRAQTRRSLKKLRERRREQFAGTADAA